MAKEKQKPTVAKTNAQPEKFSFAFVKENYKLMLIGIAVITIGMLLMIGGGSDDPNKFSNEIFSFRRITLAPFVIVAGYIIVLLAIIKKPKEKSD